MSHEDGDLVELFYDPLLRCARRYRRATGYFSGDALALAARGLEGLASHGGRMELLVGCTLGPEEIDRIEQGYEVREVLATALPGAIRPESQDAWTRAQLGWLAWMVAQGILDVKIAVPLDEHGKMRAGLGLYHAKMGIVEDPAGDRLVFRGSINETHAGWKSNCESFDVNCSWLGGRDLERVERAEEEFSRLWEGEAKSARVVDFPDALKEQLLQYLPTDDKFVKPPSPPHAEPEKTDEEEEPPEVTEAPAIAAEQRRLVWQAIRDAAARPDGAMVAAVTSAVDFWPHQLRAYRRLLDSWPARVLIADEVGLGKTITAGLMLRHAWISGLAKRVLILAPKAVLSQWQSELYEKFNLLVPIYTGSSLCWREHHGATAALERTVGRPEWTQEPIVLASSHLLRRRERQAEVLGAEDWDLVIVDEAHHARRRAPGTPREGGPNRLLRLLRGPADGSAKGLKDKARALLLLTATPMQVHPIELYDLLDVLGLPQDWSEQAFLRYFEIAGGNPDAEQLHIAARLFQETERSFAPLPSDEVHRLGDRASLGGVAQQQVLSALRDPETNIRLKRLDTKQRQLALTLLRAGTPIRHRMSRHTRGLLRTYAKRGLLDANIAEREVHDVPVELSSKERSLYEAVEDYISTTYESASADKKTAVGFIMTVYRRRLASSFHALRQTLNDRLARVNGRDVSADAGMRLEEDLPQDETVTDVFSFEEVDEQAAAAAVVEERTSIEDLLREVSKLGTDSKALELLRRLQHRLAKGYDSAIVFTQYTDTLDFLRQFLAERLDLPIGCFSGRGGEYAQPSGGWARCTKEDIKRRLRDGTIRLLLCTDAAGEGLNLQTCGVIVNYDLPWNPMKVEQRIGRIDRIGQRHEKIQVINLAYADTVEADIYFALSQRIGLFNGFVGKLQPILSQLPKEFEHAALRRREDRERARHDALQEVETSLASAERATFDIDEVSEADLTLPSFLPPPLTPEMVEEVLRRRELMPPGTECEELEPGTFKLRTPGQQSWTRITARPGVFEFHFESHQLALPMSPCLQTLLLQEGLSPLAEAEGPCLRDLVHVGPARE